MSNSIKRDEKYARSIDMNLEQFNELTGRMTGFINKHLQNIQEQLGDSGERIKITQATVKGAFLAAPDIQKRAKEEIAEKWITTNKEMREYGADIAKLTKDGFRGQRIIKELGLKSSRGTVEKFCNDNNLVGVKNG